MIKHALWESLSTGVGAEISGEAEGFVDRQESFDDEHGSSGDLGLFEDVSTTTIEHTVDTSDGDFGTLDFAQVDGLHETWCSCDEGGVQDTASCWNDLATTAMDGVSVQCHIINVETNS